MDNPGAIYNLESRLDKTEQPKYSFGHPPASQGRPIEVVTSTPITIGPTSYFRKGYPDQYKQKSPPKYTIPRSLYGKEIVYGRMMANETYED